MSKLTQNSVPATLFRMAFPMLAGTLTMNTYNLVDTWFVSRLGTDALAAMGFTFPVVMLLTFLVSGIGTGITTLTSHELGRQDKKAASRIVTHGFLLTVLVSVTLSTLGYFTAEPVFKQLGANSETLPLVKSYMNIWYFGALTMAFPMMGNGILISLGDSKSASRFMVLGAVINCLLDPILIFGWLGFPALGIQGAALATVIAQAASSVWLFYLLTAKHHLLDIAHLEISSFRQSVKKIMKFAIPGCLSMILMPISAGVITALISKHGNQAVAAVSAVGRIEMFAFVIPMALGISLIPFISQNFGANRFDRIKEARSYANRFAFIYGLVVATIFFAAAPLLAAIFTQDPEVVKIFILYVRLVSWGYGMMEIHRYCGFFLTGIHKPVSATLINAIRVLLLLIPLSLLGSNYLGIKGIFLGRLATDLLAATVALFWTARVLRSKLRIF